jgi:hypothetical protein
MGQEREMVASKEEGGKSSEGGSDGAVEARSCSSACKVRRTARGKSELTVARLGSPLLPLAPSCSSRCFSPRRKSTPGQARALLVLSPPHSSSLPRPPSFVSFLVSSPLHLLSPNFSPSTSIRPDKVNDS